ncbi:MAG: FkbM family methyltransferase [Anaerolineales bacterium]
MNFLGPRLIPADNTFLTVRAPHGFHLALDLREHLQREAYYLGYVQHLVVRIFADHVKAGTTVFDLGANFGQFTLLAAQLVGPGGQVFAFDPSPQAFAALQRNVALNGFPQVICRQVAVSNAPGTTTFYATPSTDLGTGSLAQAAAEHFHRDAAPITVNVERLDDYFDQVPRPVSVIKMDIQGAELLALQGAERLIRYHHPALLLEVEGELTHAFGYRPEDLGAYLRDLGYGRIYSVPRRPWHRPKLLNWRELESHDILCLLN